MTGLYRDIRHAARKLWQAPGFTATVVATLALGIGSSAAIFTLLDQVSLRLLPVKDAERLVLLHWEGRWSGSVTGDDTWSYPWYEDLREQSGDIFDELFGQVSLPMAVGSSGEAEQVDITLVTGNYFPTLGVGAIRGRTLGPADNLREGAHPVAVLSYEYWRERFGAEPDAVGRKILINQQPFEIVGVAQPGFLGLELKKRPAAFIPARMKNVVSTGFHKEIYSLENRRGRWMQVFGRLRESVSRRQAEAALQPILQAGIELDLAQPELASFSEQRRAEYRRSRVEVHPGGQGSRSDRHGLKAPLTLLMAMVGLLLLIACGNVANLLMARGAARVREVALRFALGAGRWRIVRQLMAESAILAVAAGALGLLASGWIADLVIRLAPGGLDSANLSTSPDWRIVGFAIMVSALTAFLFGLAPALRSTSVQVAPVLKDQAGSIAGGSDAWRRTLAGAQIFFSLLLLIAAGLFQRSLARLYAVDSGVNTAQTLVFDLDPLQAGYSYERLRAFVVELEKELEARPEIQSAGLSTMRVLGGDECMALGAQGRDVAWLVSKEVVWLFGIGAAAAIPAALVLARLLESQLYGVAPSDPATLLGATLLLAVVAVVAALPPARRAARTDPMNALRIE